MAAIICFLGLLSSANAWMQLTRMTDLSMPSSSLSTQTNKFWTELPASIDNVRHPISALSHTSSALSSNMPSLDLAAATLDPSTFLSTIFSAFLNTPIILAVPIVAALGVAGVLAFLLVKSSQPYEDE
jgi:hypothetical protein